MKLRVTKFLNINVAEQTQVWFPVKQNTETRRGVESVADRPLFPGYLFIWWNGENEKVFPFFDLYRLSGVVRILRYDNDTYALTGNDLAYAQWIHANNGVIRRSKVILREGQRLHIVEGPLKGMDGNVVKVDKHRKRITVRFDFAEKQTDILFSVEFLERNSKRISDFTPEQDRPSGDKPSDLPSDSDRPSQDQPD